MKRALVLLGIALAIFGLVWGFIPRTVELDGGASVPCGSAFVSSGNAALVDEQLEAADSMSGVDAYAKGSAPAACSSARKPWLAWTPLGVGAFVVVGALLVRSKEPDSKGAPR